MSHVGDMEMEIIGVYDVSTDAQLKAFLLSLTDGELESEIDKLIPHRHELSVFNEFLDELQHWMEEEDETYYADKLSNLISVYSVDKRLPKRDDLFY